MSDVNSNININIDASEALATIKNLQRQISLFHQEMARSGSAANQAAARGLQDTLMKNINATGQFRTQIKTIQSDTEHFTEQLERNKMSIGQYFRYAGASTKSFGKLWKSEFNTIEKVAVERVKTLQTQYIKLGRDANGALKSIAVRPLALDMNNLATKAAVAAQKQALLNQLLKQGSTSMLNWGKNTQWAGRQLMVGFTIPLAMAGTTAAKAYIDFEKAAIKFKRVYGDFNTSSGEVDKMAKSIQKLALEYTKYGVAVTDTMNMAADAAAMGKTGNDLLQQVQQANKLAVLGNVSQSQALETTISLTNAFGISADQLRGKIDFLNAVENQTVTSIEDLTIAIPKAAPVIKQLGGDVEDLAYFMTAMKEGGIDAGEGANALKSGLASIINPTKSAQDMLNGFGISLTAIRDAHSGDVAGMLKDLGQQLDGLSSMDRARAIEQTFGKFQFSRMSTLFQNITKEGSQANEVLRLQSMNATELGVISDRELKRVESSPAYKFQKVLADIQAKLVPIGEAFLKAVTPIIEWAGKLLDGFNGMGEGAKQFATIATLAVAGLGPIILMTVGLVANGVANLIKLFAGMKSFFNGTKGGTKDLGDATEYMTQKELEAQAVASSLEQSHAKLTQQFTMQSEAISNLVAEYERAIAAQQRMLGGMNSVAAGTPGFSTGGTVGGPGTATSDNLVARVSPGEEILSNATIAKGSGVIQELLNKVSGYTKPSKDSGFQETHMAMPLEKTPEVMAQMDKMVEGFSKVSTRLQETFVILSDLTATKSTTLNQKAKNAGMTSEEFSSEWNRNSGDGFKNVATRAQVSGQLEVSPEIDKAVEQLDVEIGQRIADKIDNGNIDKSVKGWLDELMASVTQEIIQEFSTSSDAAKAQVGSALSARGNTPVTYRSVGLQDLTDPKTGQPYAGAHEAIMGGIENGDIERRASAGGDQFYATGTDLQIGRTASSGKARSNSARIGIAAKAGELSYENTPKIKDVKKLEEQLNKQSEDLGKSGAEGFIEGGRDGLDSHSPSRKMHQVGMDGAEGLINGAKEGFAKIPGVPAPGSSTAPATGSIPGVSSIPGVPTPPIAEPAKTGFMSKMKGVASDLGSKGLDLVAQGIEKGKDKVVNVAGTALNNYMEAGYRQADAERELSTQRMSLASDILQATDAEYAAMQAQQDAHQKQLMDTNQATQEEIDAAIQRSEAMAKKREAIAKDIENSGQDLEVIQQRLENAQKADMVNDKEAANAQQDAATVGQEGSTASAEGIVFGQEGKKGAKDAKKAATKQKWSKVGGGLQKGAMIGTMAAGALSTMPGPVGKAAQDATPLLGSLSMLSMFITGPVTGALVALVAVVGGIMYAINKLDEAFKESAKKQMEIANKLGASEEAINGFAEATGSVTGSQYMEKSNAAKAQSIFAAPGKTTFGENFMQGDMGKGMLAAAKTSMASSGGDNKGVIANLSQQLSSAVISGALSKNQAASIASRLAYELGDMDIAFKVQAQVTDIVGPDGKSFQENPAKIASKLYAQNAEDTNSLMGAPKGKVWSGGENNATNRNVTAGGTILAAAGTGAGIGAIAGNLIPIPGVGAAAGAVVGTIIGAIAGTIAAVSTLQADAEKAGKNAGAVVANMTQGLELQKQMSDQLDSYYQKLLDEASANGDIAEYKRLQVEYDQKKKELGEANAAAAEEMLAAYTNSADQGALDTAINSGIETKFKDNSDYKLIETALNDQLNSMDKTTAYGLKAQVYNGLDFTALTKFLAANDNNATDEQKTSNDTAVNKLVGLGGTRLSDTMSAASNITDQTVRTKFLTTLSNEQDDAKAKKMTDLAMQVNALGGVMDQSINTMFNTIISDPAAQARIEALTTDLTGTKDQTFEQTIDMVYKINPVLKNQDAVDKAQAFNKEYFDSLKNEAQRDTYTSTVNTVLEGIQSVTTIDNLRSNPDFANWLTEPTGGAQYGGYPGSHSLNWWKNTYAEGQAEKVTESGSGAFTPATAPTPTPTGGGGGPEAHWTDDYVKKLRDFSMASQKLTVGINASTNALKNFKKAGQASFNGLSNQLRAAGASEAMIGHILDDDAKNIAKFFKNGKLTAAGLKVQARIYQATIAEYVDKQRSAAEVSRDTATAMRKLTAAGMSYVAASEAVGDAELAQAIAHAKNAAEVKALIAAYKQAQVELFKVNEATAEGRAKNSVDMAESHIKALEATSAKYQGGLDIIASQEESINKTYDKRMQALDKVLQINQDIAASQQDQLTMADALSKGDIFAAAKAMADQKAKDAQKNAEKQKQALTDAKDAQIKGLTTTIDGKQMTREQLEEKIKGINDQILKIKRDEINAQNELIARKEYEAKLDIAKAARGAATTSAASTGGGNPAGGSGGTGGTGGGPAGPAKPAATAKPKTGLPLLQEKATDLNKQYAAIKKKMDAQQKLIDASNSRIASYKKMGSAGTSMLSSEQAKLSGLQETKKYLGHSITSLTTQAQTLVGTARNQNSYMSGWQTAAVAKQLGINFLAGGKSPSRMGLMKHPFARGMDIMPSMVGLDEFMMSAGAVRKYGRDNMLKMNAGMLDLEKKKSSGAGSGSHKSFHPVYNINVDVAKTDAKPEEIASAVIRHLEGKNRATIQGLGA